MGACCLPVPSGGSHAFRRALQRDAFLKCNFRPPETGKSCMSSNAFPVLRPDLSGVHLRRPLQDRPPASSQGMAPGMALRIGLRRAPAGRARAGAAKVRPWGSVSASTPALAQSPRNKSCSDPAPAFRYSLACKAICNFVFLIASPRSSRVAQALVPDRPPFRFHTPPHPAELFLCLRRGHAYARRAVTR